MPSSVGKAFTPPAIALAAPPATSLGLGGIIAGASALWSSPLGPTIAGLGYVGGVGAVILGAGLFINWLNNSKKKRKGKKYIDDSYIDDRIDNISSINVEVQSPLVAERIVFGETTVSGIVAFADSTGPYLVRLLFLANHEIEDVLAINIGGKEYITDRWGYVNDDPFVQPRPISRILPGENIRNVGANYIINPDYDGDDPGQNQRIYAFRDNNEEFFKDYLAPHNYRRYLRASFRKGTKDQEVDPILKHHFPNISDDFRQLTHATACMSYYYGSHESTAEEHYRNENDIDTEAQRVWGGQTPTPQFRIRGIKVFDPRDTSQNENDSSTWKWSRNAALVTIGLLVNRSITRSITYNDFDLDALAHAADICDEGFEIAGGGVHPLYPNGASFKKFQLDGVIQSNETPLNVLQNLLLCSRSVIGWKNDKYHIITDERKEPVITITDDDIVGEIVYTSHVPQSEKVGEVKATFRQNNGSGQTRESPSRILTTPIDSNSVILDLSYVTNTYRAQYIVNETANEIILEKQTQMVIGKKAIELEWGDVVNVQLVKTPEVNGLWKVEEVSISEDSTTYPLKLKQYDPMSIDFWIAGSESNDDIPEFSGSPQRTAESIVIKFLQEQNVRSE